MLQKIFDSLLSSDNNQTSELSREQLIQLSTAALLVEISLADDRVDSAETELILSTIEKEFGLNHAEATELLEDAKQRVDASVSLFEFTSLLKDELSRSERNRIVELLWRVAYADAVLDKYEEYYVRKIADLLYITQADYIKAKHKAQETH